jgi:murein DD-endopeptidase MepM/ murein hydrolase activator NlpD
MPYKDTPTRRQLIGSALGAAVTLAGASQLFGRADRVAALGGAITGPAAATEPAVRLGITDKLTFPVDTSPEYGSLVCLNNFGGRSTANGSCNHAGVDIGNDEISGQGRPLLACADGFVEKDEAFTDSAGLTRILRDGLGTYYRYHHLDSYESSLNEGDSVTAGQLIGYMGTTGNTEWNHLHFEIWQDSLTPTLATIIDPVPRLPFPLEGVTLRAPTACPT